MTSRSNDENAPQRQVTVRRDSVTIRRMRSFVRVVAAAVALSTLSFAAGVAGDLSLADPPNYGERVVLRLPPELPMDTPRAVALPVLSTASLESVGLPARARVSPVHMDLVSVEMLVNEGKVLELVAAPDRWEYAAAKPAEHAIA